MTRSDRPYASGKNETDAADIRSFTGVITAVRAQARRPNRVSIFIDETFAYGLPGEFASSLGLISGRTIDTDLATQIDAEYAIYRAKQRALGLLSHRARTEYELTTRLRRAGFDDTVSESVIDRLRTLGYVDDEAFARSFAQSRVDSKRHGPRRILAELRRKGIAAPLAEAAVRDATRTRVAVDDAYELAERYSKRLKGVSDAGKRRRRLYGFLARRGYESDTIVAVLARLGETHDRTTDLSDAVGDV